MRDDIDIKERIIKFLRQYYNLKDMQITGKSKLILDLGISSFELLDMCTQIEHEFSVRIRDENLVKIESVNDVVNYLEKC